MPDSQQGFCVRRAEVQNSTAVFQLNISNNISFCASISRPNAKPRNVTGHCKKDDTTNRKKMTAVDLPTIRTERLLIRQFVDSDLDNVYKGLSDPEIIKYYGVNYKTIEDTEKQMHFFADLGNDRTGIWWVVYPF